MVDFGVGEWLEKTGKAIKDGGKKLAVDAGGVLNEAAGSKNNADRIKIVKEAFPAIEALIKASITDLEGNKSRTLDDEKMLNILKSIPSHTKTKASGHFNSNEIKIINTLSDALRIKVLAGENASLLEGDENKQGFTVQLGNVVNAGIDGELNKFLTNPKIKDPKIRKLLVDFKDNRAKIFSALKGLKRDNQLVATEESPIQKEAPKPEKPAERIASEKKEERQKASPKEASAPEEDKKTATKQGKKGEKQKVEAEAPLAEVAAPVEEAAPAETKEDTSPPQDSYEPDLTKSIYYKSENPKGKIPDYVIEDSVNKIEAVQKKLHKALNKISPILADLMAEPNVDGKFEKGEQRNLSAMIMLMKKLGGEENPNGAYNEKQLVKLRNALLEDDRFEMLRNELSDQGIEKIEADDSDEVKAQKRKKADDELFRHLLILQREKLTDPNAQNVTAANLAFDKIRGFLPDWVKDLMKKYLGGTPIGKLIVGVAAAKGMNLERLWRDVDAETGYDEAKVLEIRKNEILGEEFEKYVNKAEEELKKEGNGDDPDFAAVLKRAQENMVKEIDNNGFNALGKMVLGDEYDKLKEDLKTAIDATSGATDIEDAKSRLIASVSKLKGVDLEDLQGTTEHAYQEVKEKSEAFKKLEEQYKEYKSQPKVSADTEVGAVQLASNESSTDILPDMPSDTNLPPADDGAPEEPAQEEPASDSEQKASTAFPLVDKKSVAPEDVIKVDGTEIVADFNLDPGKYKQLEKPVQSKGRVKAILEAIAAMDKNTRPYDPEDLIIRDDKDKIFDLAYKNHNGALEKLSIIAQIDALIAKGQKEISMDNHIVRPITSNNLPVIGEFLLKHKVPEEKVKAAMVAAESLINEDVNGHSVMATQFGNWEQIDIKEIRGVVKKIAKDVTVTEPEEEPEIEVEAKVEGTIPEPEPVKEEVPIASSGPLQGPPIPYDSKTADHIKLPFLPGDFPLNAASLPKVPEQKAPLKEKFAFEAGKPLDPMACTLPSAYFSQGGVNFQSAGTCRVPDDAPGYTEEKRGANTPSTWFWASGYDYRVDTGKDGEAKRSDQKRLDNEFGRILGLGDWGGVIGFLKTASGSWKAKTPPTELDEKKRRLGQEILDTFYGGRETLDDAGLLSKETHEKYKKSTEYTAVLRRAATMQFAALRSNKNIDEITKDIHEIRDQVGKYLDRVTGKTTEPEPEKINVAELFVDVTGEQAIAGYEKDIKEYFKEGPLLNMAMVSLTAYKENVVAINKDEGISPQDARDLIAKELENLDTNLDAVATLKEMTSEGAAQAYRGEISRTLGKDSAYASSAIKAVDDFIRNANDIMSDPDKTMDEMRKGVVDAFKETEATIDSIYGEQQTKSYYIKLNAVDTGMILPEQMISTDPGAFAPRQLTTTNTVTTR
ncbi:MAG: hypothetical protein OEY94_06015 [Alphaproteobacteria bacterium]|nr:hypothetical protein [Alphaproteobacteria bacterium]